MNEMYRYVNILLLLLLRRIKIIIFSIFTTMLLCVQMFVSMNRYLAEKIIFKRKI